MTTPRTSPEATVDGTTQAYASSSTGVLGGEECGAGDLGRAVDPGQRGADGPRAAGGGHRVAPVSPGQRRRHQVADQRDLEGVVAQRFGGGEFGVRGGQEGVGGRRAGRAGPAPPRTPATAAAPRRRKRALRRAPRRPRRARPRPPPPHGEGVGGPVAGFPVRGHARRLQRGGTPLDCGDQFAMLQHGVDVRVSPGSRCSSVTGMARSPSGPVTWTSRPTPPARRPYRTDELRRKPRTSRSTAGRARRRRRPDSPCPARACCRAWRDPGSSGSGCAGSGCRRGGHVAQLPEAPASTAWVSTGSAGVRAGRRPGRCCDAAPIRIRRRRRLRSGQRQPAHVDQEVRRRDPELHQVDQVGAAGEEGAPAGARPDATAPATSSARSYANGFIGAASAIAGTMLAYAPQRQRLPLMRSRISSSSSRCGAHIGGDRAGPAAATRRAFRPPSRSGPACSSRTGRRRAR